jgi:hypothetical protein
MLVHLFVGFTAMVNLQQDEKGRRVSEQIGVVLWCYRSQRNERDEKQIIGEQCDEHKVNGSRENHDVESKDEGSEQHNVITRIQFDAIVILQSKVLKAT